MKRRFLLLTLVLVISANAIGSVTLILPDLAGQTSSQITVPVKVKDFQDIISCQGTIQFDPVIVTYSSVQDFGLPGMNSSSFGTTGVSSGKLTFSWYDATLLGISVSDSTTIFTITFNIIGTNTQVSPLTFVNTPTLIEIVDNAYNTLTTVLDNGSITVQNSITPSNVTLYLDSATGTVGSQVNISMKAIDFTNINSVQGTVQFDPAVATYSTVSYFGLPGMNISNFGVTQISSGKLTFTWYDSSLEGVDVADNTSLFTITFTLSCNPTNSSLLNITGTPTLIEVTDSLFNTLTTTVISGTINSEEIVVTPAASPSLICYPMSSTLSATGASSYTWMPGSLSGQTVIVNPSSTTTYTVTGELNGCTAQSLITVTVEQIPVADFTTIDNGNGFITFTNTSQNATSYSWDFGDGSFDNTLNPTHTYSANGSYTVVLTAINSCGPDIHTIIIDVIITDINNGLLNSKLEVFPNPSNGLFYIEYYSGTSNKVTIKAINTIGELVYIKEYLKNTSSGIIQLDFTKFSNGIYQIEVDNENQVSKINIVINR